MSTENVSTRRQFLASLPAAAALVAVPAITPTPAARPAPDEVDGDWDDDWEKGWTVRDHPWGRNFLLGIWQAMAACKDAADKASDCHCNACHDMRAFRVVLEMFASSIESTYWHIGRADFPEWHRKLDVWAGEIRQIAEHQSK